MYFVCFVVKNRWLKTQNLFRLQTLDLGLHSPKYFSFACRRTE